MNFQQFIIATCLVTAFTVGCGQRRTDEMVQTEAAVRKLDTTTFEAGLDPQDQRIRDFVAWLKQKGISLEYKNNPEGVGGNWKVIKPPSSEEYEVLFSIRSFPSWASEAQMRKALDVNLEYELNTRAYLAMSHAITRGTHPDAKHPSTDDELPKINGVPLTKAIEKLFDQYKGE